MIKGFYKVYINNQLLQLIDSRDQSFIQLKDESHKMIDYKNNDTIIAAIEELEQEKFARIVISGEGIDDLWEQFKTNYQVVVAAGGIVINPEGELLTIFRRGNWDLPKGKIEAGEKKKAAAKREVKEECGLTSVSIIKGLGTTYHTFGSKDKRKLKVSHWYIMNAEKENLVPQQEEDIELAEWKSVKDFMLNAKPVYPNILDVVEAYLLKSVLL